MPPGPWPPRPAPQFPPYTSPITPARWSALFGPRPQRVPGQAGPGGSPFSSLPSVAASFWSLPQNRGLRFNAFAKLNPGQVTDMRHWQAKPFDQRTMNLIRFLRMNQPQYMKLLAAGYEPHLGNY